MVLLQSCTINNNSHYIAGFWEGPHPTNTNKKFYIYIKLNQDSIKASGFWTKNNFFESGFEIDSASITNNSISFFVPNWNCYFSGKICDSNYIKGGFMCDNEPYDTVTLTKNDNIKYYLTEAKPNCNNNGYEYHYSTPYYFDSAIIASRYQSPNDSAFIYSLIPEIINNLYGRINSFLLIKNSKLICEEYFYGYTNDDLHQIESVTKSITSLLIGIAKDHGMISNIHQPLYQIFPSYTNLMSGDYHQITLSNVLSMTSGFSNEYEPYKDYDRIEFSLNRQLTDYPGTKFCYDGGNTEILGAVIKEKTKMYADEFAMEFLFKPLDITKFDWSIFKQGSFPCMGGSLQMLPRDMSKIGFLILNKGSYKNRQIVSSEWINESTSVKTKTHMQGDNYAYQWWNITLKSNGKEFNTIWANGFGSQFIYIIPQLDVVIVTTGYNYENDSWAITKGISKYLYLLDN